ncbi:3'-5' exonuclease [Marinobacter caseinilyticus]|uniref:3'-5' exonuclease n=1 Tax=Marinobacter caseinilyticus TaxID=2692195 RepID=UPI00140CE5C9|nr:3'-5' exonuclease [Marinobacter caseinilyticus]
MLQTLKNWLGQRFATVENHHNLERLPAPKLPAGQPLADIRLIVLDLETTGLSPSKDQVIAIGAVAVDGLQIPLKDQFDLILRRPELDIRETVLIHGIGSEALTRGHETEDALLYLLEWMNGDPILAFHSAFDQKFLEKSLKQTLGYSQPHTWLDVAELLPALFPDADVGRGRLDNWVDHFGLEVSERHHAAADALVTAELTLIALNQATKNGITTLSELNDKLRYFRRLKAMSRQ